MGSCELLTPKLEPGEKSLSPQSIFPALSGDVSPSSPSSDEPEGSNYDSEEASSSGDDRSDSEVDYEEESEFDEDAAFGHSTVQKKRKASSSPSLKKRSRVKTTAKRKDCYAPKQRTTNPGRRMVGRRIYDSVYGETCHWCRQKTVELHVQCTLCPIRFCGPCLLNRHGEIILNEMKKDVKWVCPKCRGGCGRGCRNCCNCGPCRKSQNLEPTGQLINVARGAGFSNVHDYLVYLKTHEDPKRIARRKYSRGWTSTSGTPVKESDNDDTLEVGNEDEDEDKHVKDECAEEDDEDEGKPLKDGDGVEEDEGKHAEQEHDEKENNRAQNEDPEETHCDTVTFKCGQDLDLAEDAGEANLRGDISDDFDEKVIKDSARWSEPSSFVEENDFSKKLAVYLERPFSMPQLREMLQHVNFRKPIMKTRQTRNRSIEVPCSMSGLSYLDHYPDLAFKLANENCPEEKLKLLRGFFFWLQHSCMEGAFRPWKTDLEKVVDDTGECMEISGPDCQVIRVLLAIDENEDVNKAIPSEWNDKKPIIDNKKIVQQNTSVTEKSKLSAVVVKQENQD